MAPHETPAREANPWTTPLRDLGLQIDGTPLEPAVRAFQEELRRRGISRVRPHFYLSTEWGVPFGSVSIAIPFYLARRDLADLYASRGGYVEGASPADVLRYLRHEMGHVINYAYKLYEEPEWQRLFGDIDQPYEEEYYPRPFSRDHVRHLPGWYAQKHPDEDWAETFAVWLTPDLDWHAVYAGAPTALEKLEYCEHTMARLRNQPPAVEVQDPDEDVGVLSSSLEQLYRDLTPPSDSGLSAELRGALRDVFEHLGSAADAAAARPAALLLRRLGRTLPGEVYRWTGHFPERTRLLVGRLAGQAEKDHLTYPADREHDVAAALTVLVTALAMNHVVRGVYVG
jgi:hypothetical protein